MNGILACLRTTVFALCAMSFAPAHAFVDPPTFDPAAPNSAQPIRVLVHNGLCHGFLAPGDGIPPMRIERSQDIVDVIVPGLITFDPFCNGPPATTFFDIGVLPAGDYEVRIWIIDLVTGFEETTEVASASLTVTQGATALSIPAIGPLAGFLLGLLIVFGASRSISGLGRSMIVSIALLGSATASAQSTEKLLMVLLSASPSAPTPQMMAEPVEYSAGYLGALSPGFTAENPDRAYYLLPRRAIGDFAAWIDANPGEARSKLERYILVSYPATANLQNALAALANDSNVLYAFAPEDLSYATPAQVAVASPMPHVRAKRVAGPPGQPWRSDIGFDRAWSLASGWSLVGTMDNGLHTAHPDLIAFDSSGSYVGGNFLPVYSADVGRSTVNVLNIEPNVDELQPVTATNVVCDPDADGFMTPTFAGHGSHVAGIISANAGNGDGTIGACRHCGISAVRVTLVICILQTGIVRGTPTIPGIAAALTLMVDAGIQVVNQSFGIFTTAADRCTTVAANDAWCLAITLGSERGILMVGASGNDRRAINFPSENRNVVAVGGLEPDLTFWNDRLDMPANLLVGDCPDPVIAGLQALGRECGSNFTPVAAGERRQEVTLPARDVYSTVYPGMNWGTVLECGDGYDGAADDGKGFCTGTSMSAPIYSGLAGILRSINPLVMPGDPENAVGAIGIRDAVVQSATVPGGAAWSAQYGYGIPDAEIAARIVLGTVGGRTVKNRLTPLFALHSAASTDLAYVTVPQAALALVNSDANAYTSQGSAISGYAAFPESPTAVPQPPTPRANTFVLTTEFKADPQHPDTVPLYWMDRQRNFPVGCTTGAGCNTVNRDFLLFTSVAEMEVAKADGFDFRGLQGYVYGRCVPEPTCVPAGAERLYRQCNLAQDDCAIFLEFERSTLETAGYTAAYPVGSNTHIGYAYRNVDSDSDGLIDGFERLIGTRPFSTDSDGDGISDGIEFPLAGISLSDPCDGPNIQCNLAALFADGFE